MNNPLYHKKLLIALHGWQVQLLEFAFARVDTDKQKTRKVLGKTLRASHNSDKSERRALRQFCWKFGGGAVVPVGWP